MFKKPGQSAKTQIPKTKLIPYLKSNIILSEERRSLSVKAIQEHLMFSETQMHQVVNPLLKNVAQCYQLLPSTQHPFYIAPGGLIDYALYRTEAAMMIFKQTALPPKTIELSISQARIAYVLFSAALLKGVGCIYTDFRIDAFNPNGRFINTWDILWDEFPETAEFYYYDILTTKDDQLKNQLTPILAKHLMPISGLKWISEEPEILLLWLQLLQEEYEGFRILEAILERSEALAWQRMAEYALGQTPLHAPTVDARMPGFIDSGMSNPQYLELIGLMFLKWLRENLARGQMLINESPLIAAEKGIAVTSEAFKWFVQQHPQFKNWRLIQQGLMALGLHEKQISEQNDLLIKKIGYLLPKEVFAKQFQHQQHFKIQSINLMHQWKNYTQGKQLNLEQLEKQLQANGQWEIASSAPSLSSKNA